MVGARICRPSNAEWATLILMSQCSNRPGSISHSSFTGFFVKHLREVIERLKKFRLRINLGKCEFAKKEIDFLGYSINRDGIKPTGEKVNAILNFPKPKNVSELGRFLGMTNFYSRCLKHAAHSQAPLLVFLHYAKNVTKD